MSLCTVRAIWSQVSYSLYFHVQSMGGGNHLKSVPLQGFKGFKLKGNCQILFKSTFKSATSKPQIAKKEEKSTVLTANSSKPTLPKPTLTIPALQALPKPTVVSPATNLHLGANHISSKEPVVLPSLSPEIKDKPLSTTPKKETLVSSPQPSPEIDDRFIFLNI